MSSPSHRSDMSDNEGSVPIRSELLCFITEKCKLLRFDDLAKICCDFYKDDEVVAARKIVEAAGHRMPKRKGADRIHKMVEDLLKAVLNTDLHLPTFYAVALSRIPPVDMTHCDATAILVEIQSLRAEVRQLRRLEQEMQSMRDTLHALQSIPQQTSPVFSGPTGSTSNVDLQYVQPQRASFASLAENLKHTGLSGLSQQPSVRRPAARKLVVGSNAGNNRVKSVQTSRSVELFVSRLLPSTTAAELHECITEATGDLQTKGIQIKQLKSRYADLYSSFHISVSVDAVDMKRAIDLLMSAEPWPIGMYVRRYFAPRNINQPHQPNNES